MTVGYYGCWENSDKSVVGCFVWKSNGHLRRIRQSRKWVLKQKPKNNKKLKTRNDANTEQPMLDARDSDVCVCAMHVHHEEETRAPLMRVTSEARLDQATWSPKAQTCMRQASMRLWSKLVCRSHSWEQLHCPYLDSTGTAEDQLTLQGRSPCWSSQDTEGLTHITTSYG